MSESATIPDSQTNNSNASSTPNDGDVEVINELRSTYENMKAEMAKVIVGQDEVVENLLIKEDHSWSKLDSIICNPINVSGAKKMKLFKRGWRNLIRNPKLIFGKKENIITHFDMHHGYGNLSRAIKKLNNEDRDEFEKFVVEKSSYNPHIMFIARKEILDKWFTTVFSWLDRCEEEFGFKSLKGYDTERLYAYLAERYLSFWFTKYTSYREHPWAFIDF